ncbi:HDOD domain-containing protein [Pseudoalteromonas sp. T1lg48]|uniref:HDOD domain-containing protein n=1 Tax=Pseudoalteromonas sp. T1lg48 TaxID=2077100 RepID=UPI000CF5F5BB|nr:HDOD domain-containing protein [Pseudoalteromonas sp. T1lg48]
MQGIDDKLLSQLEVGFKLPVKPAALNQLQAELNRSDPSLDKVSELITADVALAATVLRLINSPELMSELEITDVRQAVKLLGLNTISHLTSRYLVKQVFDQSSCCISLARFWDSATEISRLCLYLAQGLRHDIALDNVQTLGLFHDIGIPVMALNFPDYVQVLNAANDDGKASLTALEDQRYPCNHAMLGFYMAHSWHLPSALCKVILHHHDVHFLDEPHGEEEKLYYAILKIAENIAHVHKRFRNINHWHLLEPKVFATLGWQHQDYQTHLDGGQNLLVFAAD